MHIYIYTYIYITYVSSGNIAVNGVKIILEIEREIQSSNLYVEPRFPPLGASAVALVHSDGSVRAPRTELGVGFRFGGFEVAGPRLSTLE